MLGGVGIGGNHYAIIVPLVLNTPRFLRNMYKYISLVGFDLLAKVIKLLIKFSTNESN